eukprot:TRINITY_DN16255_c0_g2_i1.p1 TRINITY_DN16255_c0_g2~~TRINITY_DN16255_c0_g2_i1.p1  ORF type:complete len:440 (-),score=51.65 TRINITY_DN16255_c0_g2_i1:49-1368(-)
MASWVAPEGVESCKGDRTFLFLDDLAFEEERPVRETVVCDEARQCYVFKYPRLLNSCKANIFFHSLCSAPPQTKQGKRHHCMYQNRSGCSCFAGESATASGTDGARAFHEAMDELTAVVFSTLCPLLPRELWPNSAVVHFSGLGLDRSSLRWHADENCGFWHSKSAFPVVLLSLGRRLEFHTTLREQKGGRMPWLPGVVTTEFDFGDVISMEGFWHAHCLRAIRESPNQAGVNGGHQWVTVGWRWFVNHKFDCRLSKNNGQVQRVRRKSLMSSLVSPSATFNFQHAWWNVHDCAEYHELADVVKSKFAAARFKGFEGNGKHAESADAVSVDPDPRSKAIDVDACSTASEDGPSRTEYVDSADSKSTTTSEPGEEVWVSWRDPKTGRRCLSCRHRDDAFFADEASTAGWQCFYDPDVARHWWWHDQSKRWFAPEEVGAPS